MKISVLHRCRGAWGAISRSIMDSNSFLWSKVSPGAYRSYRMINVSCFTILHVMYCALYIGFLNEVVIGCMVLPFYMYLYCRCITFI
jgi:hypothetical protein